jgi:hypothetical protein
MEHYPEITRRDGTLFFACPEASRAAIATSIERLIDLLDTMDDDPDLEPYLAGDDSDLSVRDDREGDYADDEPMLGWPNCGQPANLEMAADNDREVDNADYEPSLGAPEKHPSIFHEAGYSRDKSQERWADGQSDEREEDGDDLEPDPSGFGDVEGMLENMTGEPELGWTAKIDQSAPHLHQSIWIEDGEPSLGWCGHGVGFQEGEDLSDTEANGDERDFSGYPDEWPGPAGANCDGSGVVIAQDMIRGLPNAASRAEAYMAVGVTPLVYHFTAKPFSYANIW